MILGKYCLSYNKSFSFFRFLYRPWYHKNKIRFGIGAILAAIIVAIILGTVLGTRTKIAMLTTSNSTSKYILQ